MIFGSGLRGNMFNYIKTFYIDMQFGPSYVATNILLLAGLALIFNSYEHSIRGGIKLLKDFLFLWLVNLLLSSVYHMVFGASNLDTYVFIAMVFISIWRFQKYEPLLRIVRAVVYYAGYFQIIAISEPIGTWLKNIFGTENRWLDHSTWITVFVLLILTVFLINHWSVESMTYVPKGTTLLLIFFAAIGVVLQASARMLDISRVYKLIVGVSFYALLIVTYYLFYLISLESKKNMEYMAMAHKEQLDRELVAATQENMEQLHILRHEIKNHMTYIRVLVAQGEYDRLFEYTNKVLGENENVLQSFNSGNTVVDAVVASAKAKAKQRGIGLETQLVIPKELPFEETDFCSLLSNLTNNAIEAAAKCSETDPVIRLQILPKQDYLFIHVTNPVGDTYSKARILSLRTTKKDKDLHGYGTKVIAKIAEKYDGSVQYNMEDGIFTADVMLDMME